jgi:hypothetical protein
LVARAAHVARVQERRRRTKCAHRPRIADARRIADIVIRGERAFVFVERLFIASQLAVNHRHVVARACLAEAIADAQREFERPARVLERTFSMVSPCAADATK